MKQVFNQNGSIIVADVPASICGDDEVLVSNRFSVISVGTESSSIQGGGGSGFVGIAKKAARNPELVKKAIEITKKDGIQHTMNIVKGQADPQLMPLGYSSSGSVIEVGKNINDISVDDRVACAGAGYANHAEIISVPRNLVCKIPEGVEFEHAAFTTLGAIAMQGVRRADVRFGDNVAVIGLGLLGQIACQILTAAGCHVIGVDMIPERVDLALELGIETGFIAGAEATDNVLNSTDGIGVDSVIIYAGTKSSEPVKQAMHMARKKGKIVVVGAVGMDLDRSPFYEKELDFLISCSYGPGRYDPIYELKGIDYPIGYVRWTENRNMQEFLNLLKNKKINLEQIIDYTFDVEDANNAYGTLKNNEKKPIGILIKYKEIKPEEITRKIEIKKSSSIQKEKINVGIIGAGGFAKAFHLPNLEKIPDFNISATVSKTGNNARIVAEKYKADYCTTDYREILTDKKIDMVLIATRHNMHAPIIIEAAESKKHIFTEKPIAMNYEDCEKILEAVKINNANLTIGFNRRFSALAQKTKKIVEKRKSPLIISYRVNSAGMKKEHWINDPIEGGGVTIGEACHFFDFFNWIIGAQPETITAKMIRSNDQSIVDSNNFVSTVSYKDGSVAMLLYATIGNTSYPKERIEMFFDGGVILIDDFKELVVSGFNEKGIRLKNIDKGQFELLKEFGNLLKGRAYNKDIPTVEDGIKATICSLKTLDALRTQEKQIF